MHSQIQKRKTAARTCISRKTAIAEAAIWRSTDGAVAAAAAASIAASTVLKVAVLGGAVICRAPERGAQAQGFTEALHSMVATPREPRQRETAERFQGLHFRVYGVGIPRISNHGAHFGESSNHPRALKSGLRRLPVSGFRARNEGLEGEELGGALPW